MACPALLSHFERYRAKWRCIPCISRSSGLTKTARSQNEASRVQSLEIRFHGDGGMSYVDALSQWSQTQMIGFALTIIICNAWMLGNYVLVSALFRFSQNSRLGTLLWASQRILQLVTRLDQEIRNSGHAVVGCVFQRSWPIDKGQQ